VLRGGSFNNDERNARCSVRNNNHPDDEWHNNGCRLGWCAAHDSLRNRRLRSFGPVAGPEMPCVQGCTAAATIDIEERQRGLFLAAAGACGPFGSAKYRIAPSPVVGRIAVGTGSTLGAGHPLERGSAEGRKTRNVPRLPRFPCFRAPRIHRLLNAERRRARTRENLVADGVYDNESEGLTESIQQS
jgi:hypothetical protein